MHHRFKESETCVSILHPYHDLNLMAWARLSWEHPYYPAHFFSLDELPKKFLANKQGTEKVVYDVVVGSRRALSAVTSFSPKTKDFGGLFTVKFGAMDSWFEEEEQLFVHCKDPYKVRKIGHGHQVIINIQPASAC